MCLSRREATRLQDFQGELDAIGYMIVLIFQFKRFFPIDVTTPKLLLHEFRNAVHFKVCFEREFGKAKNLVSDKARDGSPSSVKAN